MNESGCLGNGLPPTKKTEVFTSLIIPEGIKFDKFFLSDNLALAIDIFGQMWILGGKASLKDETLFPSDLKSGINFPLKTQFLN